ncbi:hypothetical protein NE237_012245 [Protea cynaroides]|uniref:Uncharacterized protein n=1 Tax=Protea cynaroides TaxID=273540 RepID=A0A9Q0GWI5_9MAGN|nr:hypothetical protein NE237_012245 [Protea cynaroides]
MSLMPTHLSYHLYLFHKRLLLMPERLARAINAVLKVVRTVREVGFTVQRWLLSVSPHENRKPFPCHQFFFIWMILNVQKHVLQSCGNLPMRLQRSKSIPELVLFINFSKGLETSPFLGTCAWCQLSLLTAHTEKPLGGLNTDPAWTSTDKAFQH